MHGPLWIRFAIAAIMLILTPNGISAEDAKPEPRWAEGLFDRLDVNFGTVPYGLDCIPVVTITNRLQVPLRISEVTETALIYKNQPARNGLIPGESVAIELQPKTRHFQGLKMGAVSVEFDRPEWAEVRIPIKGEIRSDLVVYPGRFDFGNVKAGKAASKTIAIKYAGAADWKITAVACQDKSFDALFREVRRESNRAGKTEVNCELTVTRRGDAPTGKIDARVVVELNDPRSKSFEVIVQGEFQDEKVKLSGDAARQ